MKLGDKMQAMPWTQDQLSDDEFREWIASRKEAGLAIDIETCELGRWYAEDADPYGYRERIGTLPKVMHQIGTNRFVRSPESCGWVCEDDLPQEKFRAMYDRIEREFRAVQ